MRNKYTGPVLYRPDEEEPPQDGAIGEGGHYLFQLSKESTTLVVGKKAKRNSEQVKNEQKKSDF